MDPCSTTQVGAQQEEEVKEVVGAKASSQSLNKLLIHVWALRPHCEDEGRFDGQISKYHSQWLRFHDGGSQNESSVYIQLFR